MIKFIQYVFFFLINLLPQLDDISLFSLLAVNKANNSRNILALQRLSAFPFLLCSLFTITPCSASFNEITETQTSSSRVLPQSVEDQALSYVELVKCTEVFKENSTKILANQSSSSRFSYDTLEELVKSLRKLRHTFNEKALTQESLIKLRESILQENNHLLWVLIHDSTLDEYSKGLILKGLKISTKMPFHTIWPDLAILQIIHGKYQSDDFDYQKSFSSIASYFRLNLNSLEPLGARSTGHDILLILAPSEKLEPYVREVLTSARKALWEVAAKTGSVREVDLFHEDKSLLFLNELKSRSTMHSLENLQFYLLEAKAINTCYEEYDNNNISPMVRKYNDHLKALLDIIWQQHEKRYNLEGAYKFILDLENQINIFDLYHSVKASEDADKVIVHALNNVGDTDPKRVKLWQRAASWYYGKQELNKAADYYNRADEIDKHASEKQLTSLDYARAAWSNYESSQAPLERNKAYSYCDKIDLAAPDLTASDYCHLGVIKKHKEDLAAARPYLEATVQALRNDILEDECLTILKLCCKNGIYDVALEATKKNLSLLISSIEQAQSSMEEAKISSEEALKIVHQKYKRLGKGMQEGNEELWEKNDSINQPSSGGDRNKRKNTEEKTTKGEKDNLFSKRPKHADTDTQEKQPQKSAQILPKNVSVRPFQHHPAAATQNSPTNANVRPSSSHLPATTTQGSAQNAGVGSSSGNRPAVTQNSSKNPSIRHPSNPSPAPSTAASSQNVWHGTRRQN